MRRLSVTSTPLCCLATEAAVMALVLAVGMVAEEEEETAAVADETVAVGECSGHHAPALTLGYQRASWR